VLYNTSDNQKKIAEALQQMWKQNLGIDVRLFNQEWKVYLDNKRTHSFQICRAGWIADYNDPASFLEIFTSTAGTNYSGWSNARYDQLFAQASEERNATKRWALLREAEETLLGEVPVLPIYLSTRVYLKSPRVQGWYPNIEDVHPLQAVWME
jgi:oligopeptide transport system substrate-binding protein